MPCTERQQAGGLEQARIRNGELCACWPATLQPHPSAGMQEQQSRASTGAPCCLGVLDQQVGAHSHKLLVCLDVGHDLWSNEWRMQNARAESARLTFPDASRVELLPTMHPVQRPLSNTIGRCHHPAPTFSRARTWWYAWLLSSDTITVLAPHCLSSARTRSSTAASVGRPCRTAGGSNAGCRHGGELCRGRQ